MSSTEHLPSSFKAWRMHEAIAKEREELSDVETLRNGGSLSLDELTRPDLADGQVLVKVVRCTINNEDLLHLCDAYVNAQHVAMPRPIGFEGSGIIVQSKAPWYFGLNVGIRVAFYANDAGALGEYVVCDAMSVSPVPSDDSVSYATAACSSMNAFTVILMVDKVKAAGHKTFISTASAGSLGRLVIKYAKSIGLDVIAIIRSDTQRDICLQDGAKCALNMKDEDFDDQLAQVIQTTGCKFAYDALGGDMPNKLLKALPNNSAVSIYSNIVSDMSHVDMNNLFGNKHLEAFNAAAEMENLWIIRLLLIANKVQKWMTMPDMTTKVQKSFPFDELPEAIAYSSASNKTGGKIQVIVNSSLDN